MAAVAGPAQVVVVGEADDPMTAALRRAAFRHAPGGSVLAALTLPQQPAGPTPEPAAALLAGRVPADGAATAYLCQDFVCRLPVTRAEELAAQLDALSGAG